MNKYLFLLATFALLSLSAPAQTKSNDVISKQIKALRGEKAFTLSYDQNSNVSKLMAVTDNFDDTGRIGVQAMNFAIGFMYSGKSLTNAPDKMIFTFWVLTKKPRFASNHNLSIKFGNTDMDLGTARYVSRTRDNMEYLNFEISRDNLTNLAGQPAAKVRLGDFEINFTREQIRILSDLLTLSDPAK